MLTMKGFIRNHLLGRTSFRTSSLKLSLGALGLMLLTGGQAVAAEAWDKHGKSCDKDVFAAYDKASLADLVHCSKVWVAYRTDYGKVKDGYKNDVVQAMLRVYREGNASDQARAGEILERLGMRPMGDQVASPGKSTPPMVKREVFRPDPASKADVKKAEAQFRKGFAAYKKKDYEKAASFYVEMTKIAPGYAKGHYNAACAYALLGNDEEMGKYLRQLWDMSAREDEEMGEEAKSMLAAVKKDSDFDGAREGSAAYKEIMGYAKVSIINHLGELGEENVENLEDNLGKLGYVVELKSSKKKVPAFPVIYYSDHSKTQAFLIRQLISHEGLETKYLEADKLCGDDGCVDVAIQWSDDVKDEPKVRVPDPRDAERKIADLERQQDAILREPDRAVQKVENALDAPDRAVKRVENVLEKPGKAVKKVEKTVDKIKGLF